MDINYTRYVMQKIESAMNDYTTMSREDVAEYVLACLKCLMEEYTGYEKLVGKSK